MNKGIQPREGVKSTSSKAFGNFISFVKTPKKFIAFTLAETLIVMGIIGVVAALTIPNLNSSTNHMEKVTRVKKIYAELNEAHNRATAVYGPVSTWFTNDGCTDGAVCLAANKRYFDRIVEFMKPTKICRDSNNGCWVTTYPNYLSGGSGYGWSGGTINCYPSAILAGGSSICIWKNVNGIGIYPKFNSNQSYTGYRGISSDIPLYIDIDGPNKGKKTFGIDIFEFIITKNGVQPCGGGSDWTTSRVKDRCFMYGPGCAAWVINNGNMDYLDTVPATSIIDGGVCKNDSSKVLSTTVSSCK